MNNLLQFLNDINNLLRSSHLQTAVWKMLLQQQWHRSEAQLYQLYSQHDHSTPGSCMQVCFSVHIYKYERDTSSDTTTELIWDKYIQLYHM